MRSILSLVSLASAALAAPRLSAPRGCKVVSKTPTSGDYRTVQAAVDSLSTSTTAEQCIFIYQGTYTEQVHVKALQGPLTIYGYTPDTSGYAG